MTRSPTSTRRAASDAASGEFRITTVADGTNVTAVEVFVSPAAVPVGSTARIVLTVRGDMVAASLNGIYNLDHTLPTEVMMAINGTAVGLRQTVAGIDTTSFDDLTVTDAAADGSWQRSGYRVRRRGRRRRRR